MNLHIFDQAIALQPLTDGQWSGHTHAGWWNMVGPFGGVTAAAVVRAISMHPQCLGDPAALTVNYVAAVTQGPFTVHLQVARTNRSSQHWQVEMTQLQSDGSSAKVMTGTAMTAIRRNTYGAVEAQFPHVPAAQSLRPWTPPISMEWFNRYDIRVVQGAMPEFAGSGPAIAEAVSDQQPASLTRQWVRYQPARALDYAALAAMADVFYPRVWLHSGQRLPAGTVSMTVYFHANAADLADAGDGYVLCEARAQAFRNGHSDQTAQLWSAQGTMLATTHQLVYYK